MNQPSCLVKHFFQMVPALAAALVLTGCTALRDNMTFFTGPIEYDVTSKPAWWGEMHRGEVLALNRDTLLNDRALELSASKDTGTYNSDLIFGHTITVEMFKANPWKYWEDLHLLPKGTRLRCVKLERWFSDEGKTYRISAEILDGEFKGRIGFVCPWGDPNKKGSLKLGPYSLVHPVEQ